MDAAKRARLEARGYMVVDDAADWLGLDEVERQVVEFRVRVGGYVRRRREGREVSQAALAKVMGSSQSRVAKVEASADGVGIDLLMRAFFSVGGTMEDLAKVVAGEIDDVEVGEIAAVDAGSPGATKRRNRARKA